MIDPTKYGAKKITRTNPSQYGAVRVGAMPTKQPESVRIGINERINQALNKPIFDMSQNTSSVPTTIAKSLVNSGQSLIKFNKGVLDFLNPVNTYNAVKDTVNSAKGYIDETVGAEKSRKQADILSAKVKAKTGKTSMSDKYKDTTNLNPVMQFPKAAYETLVPPAVQTAVSGTRELLSKGKSSGQYGSALQSLAEDPYQLAPAFLMSRGLIQKKLPVVDKGIGKVGQLVTKPVEYIAERSKKFGSEIAKYGTAQATGFSPKTIETIIKNPKYFSAAEASKYSREGIASEVKTGIEQRLQALSSTGKAYEAIRKSTDVVEVKPEAVKAVFEKNKIGVDQNGKIVTTQESIPMSAADKGALQEFINTFNQTRLSGNAFLNARTALSNMASYDMAKTSASKVLARELRGVYDEAGKKQIKGLEQLDKQYSTEKGILDKVKKDYFNADGTFKDGAVSKIANLSKEGRQPVLQRLEQIRPNIGKEVRILAALEDIQAAKGQKVGVYSRSLIAGGVGFTAGGIMGAIVAAILTSPSMAVSILRGYAKLKGIPAESIKKVINEVNAILGQDVKDLKTGLSIKSVKQIDSLTKNEMVEAIDYLRLKKPYNQVMEEKIGKLAEKYDIKAKTNRAIANDLEKLVEQTKTKDTSGRVVVPKDPLHQEALKYKRTVNIQDKNDLEYLGRILSQDQIADIKAGKTTNFRGKSYEDLARVNIISKTPQTIEQQLAGKIKDIKLKSDTFYHGTSAENARGIMSSGFKNGGQLPEDTFRGGGYGQIQNSISLTETPKDASRFSTLSKNGEIVEAQLKPNSKVVSIEGIEDAVDLEDFIPYLKKQKIDAVYIGGGEKELVVINSKVISPTKSQLTDIYNKAHKK